MNQAVQKTGTLPQDQLGPLARFFRRSGGIREVWLFGSALTHGKTPRDFDVAVFCEHTGLFSTIRNQLKEIWPSARVDEGGYLRAVDAGAVVPPHFHFLLVTRDDLNSAFTSAIRSGRCLVS